MQVIKIMMTEDILQCIWQYQILDKSKRTNLKLVDGTYFQILNVGERNQNQGPDFLNAKILINDIEWNGNVEIHLKSSLWKKHKHHLDKKYDNIILHVVLMDDEPVKRENGELIPCVEFETLIPDNFIEQYNKLIEAKNQMPCEFALNKITSHLKESTLKKMIISRLERKSKLFEGWWISNNKDWQQTLFEVVSYCLGLKINADNFYKLAHSISYKTLLKYADNPTQIKSILFGLADFDKKMGGILQKEYGFLSHKHHFTKKIDYSNWNYFRLRPSSFPEKRIMQLAALVLENKLNFSKLISIRNVDELKQMFVLEKEDNQILDNELAIIGEDKINNILINGVLPLIYLLYKKEGDLEYLNKVFFFLENIPFEVNKVTKVMCDFFNHKNAFDSQSQLELYHYYCENKKCLACPIGKEICS